jgi:hypothetical protein
MPEDTGAGQEPIRARSDGKAACGGVPLRSRNCRARGRSAGAHRRGPPGTANSPAIAQMRDLVDEITAVLQEE